MFEGDVGNVIFYGENMGFFFFLIQKEVKK